MLKTGGNALKLITDIYTKFYETGDVGLVLKSLASQLSIMTGGSFCFVGILSDVRESYDFIETATRHRFLECRDVKDQKNNNDKIFECKEFVKKFCPENTLSTANILDSDLLKKYGFEADNMLFCRLGAFRDIIIIVANSSKVKLNALIADHSILTQVEKALEVVFHLACKEKSSSAIMQQIMENAGRFTIIIKALPVSVIVLNCELDIITVSDKCVQEFFYKNNKLSGNDFSKMGGEFYNYFADYIKEALEGKSFFKDLDSLDFSKKEPCQNFYKWKISPAKVDDTIVGVSIILENISQTLKYEKILELNVKKLKRYNEELESFSRICAHDLKEPLRSIYSFAEILQQENIGNLSENSEKYLEFILKNTSNLQKLIDKLGSYTKATARSKNMEFVSIDEIVDDVEFLLSYKISQNNAIIIRKDLGELFCDRVMITQLFQNLVDNAIKYKSDKDPIIEITRQDIKGNVVFVVKDNGIGIKNEYRKKVFDFFVRIDNGKTGTGLGLALCKRVMDKHYGKIWLKSDGKDGTDFYLLFKQA